MYLDNLNHLKTRQKPQLKFEIIFQNKLIF
jgi:hypothetical protein